MDGEELQFYRKSEINDYFEELVCNYHESTPTFERGTELFFER